MIKTEIEWFAPEEKMPEKGTTEVLVVHKNSYKISTLDYSDEKQLFNDSNNTDGKYAFDVGFWAYIPNKIKGE